MPNLIDVPLKTLWSPPLIIIIYWLIHLFLPKKNVFQVNSRPRRVQGAAPHRDAIEQRGFGAEPRAEREHSLRQVPGPDGDTAAVQAQSLL